MPPSSYVTTSASISDSCLKMAVAASVQDGARSLHDSPSLANPNLAARPLLAGVTFRLSCIQERDEFIRCAATSAENPQPILLIH